MREIAEMLRERAQSIALFLSTLSESDVSLRPGPDRWCKKEILGHLIDSASNNHQRFVRAQLQSALEFPGYEQEGWARCQRYIESDWRTLIELWRSYNLHLADVIERVEADKEQTQCQIGDNPPTTLRLLAEDYLHHLDHHITQLRR